MWKQGWRIATMYGVAATRAAVGWILLALASYAPVAVSDSECHQYTANTGTWHGSVAAALAERPFYCAANQHLCNNLYCTPAFQAIGRVCTFVVTAPPIPPLPAMFTESVSWTATTIGHPPGSSSQTTFLSVRANPAGCQKYVSAALGPASKCGASCNSVGDPIDPATGGMYVSEPDVARNGAALEFKRFFNSEESNHGLSSGWRYSFSRGIKPVNSSSSYRAYAAGPDNSSLYSTESSACTSGFAQIKSHVAAWSNAAATYENNSCIVRVGATIIGLLPILYRSPPTPAPGSTAVIGFEVTRDDGELVTFPVVGSVVIAPAGAKSKLEQTSSGYLLTSGDDSVEAYDTSGKLLSITDRAGLVQHLSYNSSGQLSTVADSFGHSLTLTYDAQGRLSSVTRQ